MRITNPTIARNYNSTLNRNLGRLNSSMTEVSAYGRKIFKMSDSTSTGVRAMNIRRSLSQIDGYIDNAKNAQSKFNMADKTLETIAGLATDIYARYNYAINGTNSETEREIVAKEFEQLRDEILTSANTQYADRHVFGGTNTMSPPFTYGEDEDGKRYLIYNNVRVSDISKGDGTGPYDYLFSDAAYVDVGLGMTMQGTSQDVVPSSALKNTLNGLDLMGWGDNNLYDTVTELIDSLRRGGNAVDMQECGGLLNKIRDMGNNVNLERTRVGSDLQYLEYTLSRLEDEKFALTERQDSLEFRDPAEAIMDLEMHQYVYNASLQMGSRLLQSTLFDFIR